MGTSTPLFGFGSTHGYSQAHSHSCTRQGYKPATKSGNEYNSTHLFRAIYIREIGLVQNYIELAWLPVSIELSIFPLAVFQNLIHLSAVPPPDATRLCWWGDHAIALTAAVCSVSRSTGCCDRWFHTRSWLSFPPDASSRSSCDHFSPQTWEDSWSIHIQKELRNPSVTQQDPFNVRYKWVILQGCYACGRSLTSDLWPENLLM